MVALTQAVEKQREFSFTTEDFEYLRALVTEHTGIKLADAKRDMVYGRLVRRLRHLGLGSFSEYCEHLQKNETEELGGLINAITTNLTSFFREPHHFKYLGETLLPELLAAKGPLRRVRIWCAGCSTGEEPYSIAMAIKEHLPQGESWDVKILATDIDSNVLEKAASGVYLEERVEKLDRGRLRRWFRRGRGEQQGLVKVSPVLREMIGFRQLNLMNPWPMKGPFDIIFCRNVVIYFDKATQKHLFDRMADILVEEGHLLIGHSESLFRVSDRFRLIGNTIYRRCL